MSAPTPIRQPFLLPPLILHPFADAQSQLQVLASARASLALDGWLPGDESSEEVREHIIMDGRYREVEMLIRLGQDLFRWIDQCTEVVRRRKDLFPQGINRPDLMAMLIEDIPRSVLNKLREFGVAEHRVMFKRALGLSSVFAHVPHRGLLADGFVRSYFAYADQFFVAARRQESSTPIDPAGFVFELYSSAEYSRILEKEWDL